MNAVVRGMALYLPPEVRRNEDWPPSFAARFHERRASDLTRIDPTADAIGAIAASYAAKSERDPFRGTRTRHVVRGETSSDAATRAARAALIDADVAPHAIDLILSHALVPDRVSPPDAARIAAGLGIEQAAAYGLDAVCASVVAQLVVASAMIESGRARNVLLVQSHVISPTLDWEQPASAIFGDAASALVLGQGERGGLVADVAAVDGRAHDAVTFVRSEGTAWYASGGPLHPGSGDRAATDALTSRLLHHGVRTLEELLVRAQIAASEVDVLATIQPTAWYPRALADAIGLPADRAPVTFERIAHIGACGVVANLLDARSRGLLSRGALVALYAHGAGMNRVGALLRY